MLFTIFGFIMCLIGAENTSINLEKVERSILFSFPLKLASGFNNYSSADDT